MQRGIVSLTSASITRRRLSTAYCLARPAVGSYTITSSSKGTASVRSRTHLHGGESNGSAVSHNTTCRKNASATPGKPKAVPAMERPLVFGVRAGFARRVHHPSEARSILFELNLIPSHALSAGIRICATQSGSNATSLQTSWLPLETSGRSASQAVPAVFVSLLPSREGWGGRGAHHQVLTPVPRPTTAAARWWTMHASPLAAFQAAHIDESETNASWPSNGSSIPDFGTTPTSPG